MEIHILAVRARDISGTRYSEFKPRVMSWNWPNWRRMTLDVRSGSQQIEILSFDSEFTDQFWIDSHPILHTSYQNVETYQRLQYIHTGYVLRNLWILNILFGLLLIESFTRWECSHTLGTTWSCALLWILRKSWIGLLCSILFPGEFKIVNIYYLPTVYLPK